MAIAESAPRQEGNQMHTILSGKPDKSGKRPGSAPASDPVRRPAAQTTTATAAVAARPLAGQAVAPAGDDDGRELDMPKLKTHRGAAKRFKKSASGKILRSAAFKRHILTSKTTKRKRGLRGDKVVCRRRHATAGADASVQIVRSS